MTKEKLLTFRPNRQAVFFMHCLTIRQTVWVGTVIAISFWSGGATAAEAPSKTKRPDWPIIEQTVNEYFAAQPDHHAADIISQDQVKAILTATEQLGWKPADADEIVKATPGNHEALVRVFRTK